MGIDMSSRRCIPVYEALARLTAAPRAPGRRAGGAWRGRGDLANPLLVRAPLDRGVRVIAAHCASLGASADVDATEPPVAAPTVSNPRSSPASCPERATRAGSSEISPPSRKPTVPAPSRSSSAQPRLGGRLLNGSTTAARHPALFSLNGLVEQGVIDPASSCAAELRQANSLLFDFVRSEPRLPRRENSPLGIRDARFLHFVIPGASGSVSSRPDRQ